MKSMSDSTYHATKWIGLTLLPACVTLIGAIGATLGWEHTGEACAIVGAIGVFLSGLIGASSHAYKKEQEGE